ncbi:hypothetical protein [Rhodopila sp.]|uniref:hypothetical protein n=1 Tax=Rhodopila sp. TaxID=2480087 RepID=UPI003D13C72D
MLNNEHSDGQPLPEDICKEQAERNALNAREHEAWARTRAAARRDAITEANEALAGYMAEALDRARLWALFHVDRAEARSLPKGEAAFMRVAGILNQLHTVIEARSIRPRLIWVARAAYDAAFSITECETGGRYPEAALHQLVEAEDSPIRALCWTMAFIADQHWQLAANLMTPIEARLAAANDLIDAPLPPPLLTELETP